MSESQVASDHEVESDAREESPASRHGSPNFTRQCDRAGSPNQQNTRKKEGQSSRNRNQPSKKAIDSEMLMNINDNMGQMAALLTTLVSRFPEPSTEQVPEKQRKTSRSHSNSFLEEPSDERPPDRKRRLSRTQVTSPSAERCLFESDSHESATPDEDDRSYKRRKPCEDERMSVHASDNESEDIRRLTEPHSQKAKDNGQLNADNLVLKELAHSLDEEETTGPAIQKQLAEIADKRWGSRLTPEKIKTLTERYNRPENISKLIPTKVNNEIWSQLSAVKRKMDLQLSNLQQTLRKVAITILQTGDELLPHTNGAMNKNLASRAVDAIAMLGHANAEVSRLRREQIRYALRPEYASLCKADIPNGPLLFGEDLTKNLKEAKEANAIGRNLTNQSQKRRTAYRDKPYSYNMDKRPTYSSAQNRFNKGQKREFFWRGQSHLAKRRKPPTETERK